jgi:enterochelin esterase-like enzyme
VLIVLFALAKTAAAFAADTAPAGHGDFAGFDDFLVRYRSAPHAHRAGLAAGFVQWQRARQGFPMADAQGNVIFFYVGAGHEAHVHIVGDWRSRSFDEVAWDDQGQALERAADGGDVFFARIRFEKDARLDYRFVVDGDHRLDPLNEWITRSGAAPLVTGGLGDQASELIMPGHVVPDELGQQPEAGRVETESRGELRTVDEPWASPKITIYLPPGHDPARRYAVVYTADGGAWRDIVGLPGILDYLILKRQIAPVIAVMIEPAADRAHWYGWNARYLAYLDKVVAYVDGHYRTKARGRGRLHLGTSEGGRASLAVGLERPELFRNVALMSASLIGAPHRYEPYFSGRKAPSEKLRVWLSAGTYEGYILADTRMMDAYLRTAGATVRSVYTHQGHSFGAWRGLTGRMLRYFFPVRTEAPRAAAAAPVARN